MNGRGHAHPQSDSFGNAWFVLAPDVIRPQQYLKAAQAPSEGERDLMRAVLQLAVEDVTGNARATRIGKYRLYRDALAWFRSEDTDWPFSFENVCQVLGVSEGAVRDVVRRWTVDRPHRPIRVPKLVSLAQRRRALAQG